MSAKMVCVLKDPVDPHTHIRKSISIQLTSSEPFVLVKHSLENLSDKPITLRRGPSP